MRILPVLMTAVASVAAAAAAGAEEASAHVELRPFAEVSGAGVSLGDVATIRGGNLQQVRGLATLPIGPAPTGEKAVSRAALERWVAMKLGSSARGLNWSGAAEVVVRLSSRDSRDRREAHSGEVRAPLVPQGAWVKITLRSGVIELEGRGRALQDAGLGQIVKVQTVSGAEPISARVLGAGRVEAQL